MTIRFSDLPIGTTFDFIHPEPGRTSYFARIIKTGFTTYAPVSERRAPIRVSTVKVEVFHATFHGEPTEEPR